jgi:glyoxylase-like metal-dependent hydrolase (beta-lactamase superfamily II)
MKLHVIDTGFFKLDGGAMFGVVPKSIWKKLNPPDENNLCTWAMRCLLIEEGNRKILIDTGLGDKQSEKFFSYYEPHGDSTLLSSLKDNGFKVEDITDVILTHLHFDHVGGAVKREGEFLVPTFPNANYYVNKTHWEHALDSNPREKASFLEENILPLKQSGKLRLLESGEDFSSNIKLRTFNGHTTGMWVPEIKCNGKTIFYCADLIPSTAHIPVNFVMSYDIRPLVTMEESEIFLKEVVEKQAVLFFEHDPVFECCEVLLNEKGKFTTKRLGKLSDFQF